MNQYGLHVFHINVNLVSNSDSFAFGCRIYFFWNCHWLPLL